MIFSEEEGILTQNQNINAEPYELKKSIRLCVANETKRAEEMVVRWSFSFGRFYCFISLFFSQSFELIMQGIFL